MDSPKPEKPRHQESKMSIAILGSGGGTNFQAVADCVNAGELDVRIACVISDVRDAFILERARRMGVPAEYVDHAPFRTKLDGAAEMKMLKRLAFYGADFVVLAGYMRIIKRRMLDAFPRRIVNIHPSLLPAFPGIDSWKQALDYGVKIAGCTVHYVDDGMDTGPIILQRAVPVLDDDTPETLHARIQKEEHRAYPEAIRRINAGIVPKR